MLITTNTINSEPYFGNDAYAREAIESLYRIRKIYPFYLYEFVIMPDHIHLFMKVNKPYTISKIMNVYKSGLTFNIGIKKLWQARFDIRIVKDANNVIQYIHMNPVKAELVSKPEDYPWSSASGKWDTDHLN